MREREEFVRVDSKFQEIRFELRKKKVKGVDQVYLYAEYVPNVTHRGSVVAADDAGDKSRVSVTPRSRAGGRIEFISLARIALFVRVSVRAAECEPSSSASA